MEVNKIILGIDPGTNIMGYGLIHLTGKSVKLIAAGVIDLSKFEDHHLKLQKILRELSGLLRSIIRMRWPLKLLFLEKMFNPCSN